jgi:PAS domain S-box-containing protein
MPLKSLIEALAAVSDTSVVLTDGALEPPGPRILYVNAAFERMSGYRAKEVVGRDPRFLQGPGTSVAARKRLAKALREGLRCKVVLLNYRKSGEPYRCAIDVYPIMNPNGGLLAAVALEREVERRPGRPVRKD